MLDIITCADFRGGGRGSRSFLIEPYIVDIIILREGRGSIRRSRPASPDRGVEEKMIRRTRAGMRAGGDAIGSWRGKTS